MPPIDPTTALFAASLGMNLMNNIYKSKQISAAQAVANRYNLDENQKNRDFQRELVEMQMKYNSIPEQMRQYREAGLSPYALVGSTSSISGASAPSSLPVQPEPVVNPFEGMDIQAIFGGMKTLAETDAQQINNRYLAQFLDLRNKELGLQVDTSALSYEVMQATKDAQITMQNAAAERERFESDLRKRYGADLTEWQIDKLIKEVEFIEQQGWTQESQRSLNSVLEKFHLDSLEQRNIELSIQRYAAQSQAMLNQSIAALQASQKKYQDETTGLLRRFGVLEHGLNLIKGWSENVNTRWRTKMTDELIHQLRIKNKWMNRQEAVSWANQIISGVNNIVQLGLNVKSLLGVGSGSVLPITGAPGASSLGIETMLPLPVVP